MIISSWNVNSVRARIDNIKDYLKNSSPEILLMQEIKTEDPNFPYDDFKKLNYESYVFGQKSYNGVAIIAKKKLENVDAVSSSHSFANNVFLAKSKISSKVRETVLIPSLDIIYDKRSILINSP